MANVKIVETPEAATERVSTVEPAPVAPAAAPGPTAVATAYEDTGVRRVMEAPAVAPVVPTVVTERWPQWGRWGAVIAGFLLAVGAQLLLGLLGHAISFTAVAVARAPGTRFAAVFSILWFAAEVLVTTLLGGYMAARLSRTEDRREGAISGALTWALGIVLALGAVGALGVGGFELGAASALMTSPMSMPPAELLFAWSLFGLAMLSLVTAMVGGAAGAGRNLPGRPAP